VAETRPAAAPALRIEDATPADAPSLAALVARVAVPGWSEASLASSIGDADAIALVVRAGPTPIGFVLARAAAGEAEVLLVAVAPSARRRGIARRLLDAALARSRARVAHLEVRASNAAAIALYERAGFVAVGRRPRYYDDGEDALTMRRRFGADPA